MNELVGAWRMTAAKWTFQDGEAVDLYGEAANGRILFTDGGWMTVIIVGGGAGSAEGGSAQPMTIAYSGRYSTEPGRFTTDVDVSSMTPWVGTAQAREYQLDTDALTIVLGMPMHPAHPGRPGRGTLVWERE